jgi:RNA recognition motif-containing protein
MSHSVVDECTVYIGGVETSRLTKDEISKDFASCGEITKITIPEGRKCIFVKFKYPAMANYCINNVKNDRSGYYRGFQVTVNIANDRRRMQAQARQNDRVEQLKAEWYDNGFNDCIRRLEHYNYDIAQFISLNKRTAAMSTEGHSNANFEPGEEHRDRRMRTDRHDATDYGHGRDAHDDPNRANTHDERQYQHSEYSEASESRDARNRSRSSSRAEASPQRSPSRSADHDD